MAPRADLWIGRIWDSVYSVGAKESAILECGNRAVYNNYVKVLLISFATSHYNGNLQQAINSWTKNRGVNVIAAAGNCGHNGCYTRTYPADYGGVVGVGATEPDGTRAEFSDIGSRVDLMAPGQHILSTTLGGYNYGSGTSYAAPFVAGIYALNRAQGESREEAGREIYATARDMYVAGHDNRTGAGRVNAYASVRR